MTDMNGILLIDKPKDWTSFDVVGKVRSIITKSELNETGRKHFPVGHTGTLDPQATGLLVLLLGKYTKKATELTKLDKTYEVTMKLGETSTTGDEEGEKSKTSDTQPTQAEIERAIAKFTGEIMQTPPVYSAIKINGQRAYKLAREGREVVIEPRKVSIYKSELQSYDYPFIKFTAEVSSGTYIRSLVEDLGKELKTGAYMSDLRRTKIGQFDLKNAMTVQDLSAEKVAANAFEAK
jgi:tRNA pseudouridine55 synthase